jgi:hypothetical protein
MKALEGIHDSVLQPLEAHGVKIRLSPTLTDADPSLAGVRPRGWTSGTWEQADGLYNPVSKEVIVAEGVRRPTSMEPIKTNRPGVARHEVGHGVDRALGMVSQSPEFQAAHSADIALIPKVWHGRLNYFMQPFLKDAGRSEAFADLFGVLHGGPCDGGLARVLRQHFPQTLQVMADMLSAKRSTSTP